MKNKISFVPTKEHKNTKIEKKREQRAEVNHEKYSIEQELKDILKRLNEYGNTICSKRIKKKFETNENIRLYFAKYGIHVRVYTGAFKHTIIELEDYSQRNCL